MSLGFKRLIHSGVEYDVGYVRYKESFSVLRISGYPVGTNCIGCHHASTVSWIPPRFTIRPRIPKSSLH